MVTIQGRYQKTGLRRFPDWIKYWQEKIPCFPHTIRKSYFWTSFPGSLPPVPIFLWHSENSGTDGERNPVIICLLSVDLPHPGMPDDIRRSSVLYGSSEPE